MTNQAVISLAGKQHLVSPGETLQIDKHLDAQTGETITLNEVLLLVSDEKTQIGTPLVKGASVALKVLELGKAKKVTTARFKAKSRFRRKVGHRQPQTTLEVVSIKQP